MNSSTNAIALLNAFLEALATALSELIAQFGTALAGFLNTIIPI